MAGPIKGEGRSSPQRALLRLAVTVAALLGCILIGTGVVIQGVVFGVLLFVVVFTMVTRVPRLELLLKQYPGWADVTCTVMTFVLLGGSVTALVAGATVGTLVTLVLTVWEIRRTPGGPRGCGQIVRRGPQFRGSLKPPPVFLPPVQPPRRR